MSQDTNLSDSEFLRHEPCPSCGSRDNLARYSDGHGFCFGCEHYEHGTDDQPFEGESLLQTVSKAIPKRKLTQTTTAHFGYGIAKDGGKTVQVANYYDDQKNLIAQKIRTPDKKFKWKGNSKDVGLYGQWLWRDGGKMITLCEGEIDCLSISQTQDNKWPVVSVSHGVTSSIKSVKKSLDWLEKFDRVNICLDQDVPGKKYSREIAKLFSPGKAHIVTLPLKDPSEMLVSGRARELTDAIWSAKVYHPDGIVDHSDLLQYIKRPKNKSSIPYPFEGLNEKTHGMRRGELVTWCAGSGVGKSQVCRQIADELLTRGEKVGYIALEESVQRTAEGMMSLKLGKAIHLDTRDWNELSDDEQAERTLAYDKLEGLYCYDHFGSIDSDNLINRIRFMAKALDVHWVVLDHLTIMSSAIADGDERRTIDATMTSLRSLVEECNIGLILVSHLRRPDGNKGYENGIELSLNALRGSHSIAQLSDLCIGIERDLNGDERHVSTIRVLKNRFSGDTGVACTLRFDPESTKLTEYFSEESSDIVEMLNDF